MKKKMGKLTLAKETLRALEDQVTRKAAGGCSLPPPQSRNASCITDVNCPTDGSCACSVINTNCC
jgi:hypothetical protein